MASAGVPVGRQKPYTTWKIIAFIHLFLAAPQDLIRGNLDSLSSSQLSLCHDKLVFPCVLQDPVSPEEPAWVSKISDANHLGCSTATYKAEPAGVHGSSCSGRDFFHFQCTLQLLCPFLPFSNQSIFSFLPDSLLLFFSQVFLCLHFSCLRHLDLHSVHFFLYTPKIQSLQFTIDPQEKTWWWQDHVVPPRSLLHRPPFPINSTENYYRYYG